jgi:hypothetical protein
MKESKRVREKERECGRGRTGKRRRTGRRERGLPLPSSLSPREGWNERERKRKREHTWTDGKEKTGGKDREWVVVVLVL